MYRARIHDEIHPRPRKAGEEISRQKISLESIALGARQHDVARHVRPTPRQRMDVVERREVELERRGAVDASSAAIAHRGALDRSFLMPGRNGLGPAARAGQAWEGDTVKMPTS